MTVATQQAPRRPALRYHGGKWRLGPWIIRHFPAHRVYTEAFGGAASVLLQKPRTYAEVYNDLDGEVVNVFRCLRERRQELEALVRATPFARTEFTLSYQPADDALEQARRTIFRSFAGFGSAAIAGQPTGFRCDSNRSGTTPAHDWANYPDHLAAFEARLGGVVIESRNALDVLVDLDSAYTLHYVDPPYPHSTRTFKARPSGAVYRHEMSDDDHRALATVLCGLSGMVVLSGYPCDLYDVELFPTWKRVERKALADGAKERTEVLWINPAAWSALQRDRVQGGLFGDEP